MGGPTRQKYYGKAQEGNCQVISRNLDNHVMEHHQDHHNNFGDQGGDEKPS
jgi:ribosomal protein S15P/S13E